MTTQVPTTGPGLLFGIYAGGAAGTDTEIALGPPDEVDRIVEALDRLQGDQPGFLVRCYLAFTGDAGAAMAAAGTPRGPFEAYLDRGRQLDLVLCCWDADGRRSEWTECVRRAVRRWGPHIATLQIGEEPNLYHYPGDGRFFPHCVAAVVEGVLAAREEADRLGYPLSVGFNAVPCFDPADRFWSAFARAITPDFLHALGYVGFDFFPDVFRRVPPDGTPGDLASAVTAVLRHFRQTVLRDAGIPESVPLHIAETGWPTGPDRSAERQAEVIERVVRTAASLAAEINLRAVRLFALRDADSGNPDLFRQFGLMRDDYSPKPAFDAYARLIGEFGLHAAAAAGSRLG